MPLKDNEYKPFMERSCDEIADWIAGDQKQKDLFVKDLNERQDALIKFNADYEAEDKRYRDWFETPAGRSHTRKRSQWDQKMEVYEEWQKNQLLGSRCSQPKHPGLIPIPDFKHKEPIYPLQRFAYPIEHETFTINDYRVLLGALHDGFLWEQGDMGLLICPHMAKRGTIVDFIYWGSIREDSRYRRSIKKALQELKAGLEEPKDKDGKMAKRKSEIRTEESPTILKLASRFVPFSVARGSETLEAYSMRKVAQENERRAKEQAKQERFRKSSEKGRKFLTDPKVRVYWLSQIKGPMSGKGKYWGHTRYEWPKDKAFIYAIMAICIDDHSTIKIVPESLTQTEQFKVNKNISFWVMESDSSMEFMNYIEADLQSKGILPGIDKPPQGSDECKHPVTLKVAMEGFRVSRSSLMRKIKNGELKSYRPEQHSKSSPHIVDAVEVAAHFPRRTKT